MRAMQGHRTPSSHGLFTSERVSPAFEQPSISLTREFKFPAVSTSLLSAYIGLSTSSISSTVCNSQLRFLFFYIRSLTSEYCIFIINIKFLVSFFFNELYRFDITHLSVYALRKDAAASFSNKKVKDNRNKGITNLNIELWQDLRPPPPRFNASSKHRPHPQTPVWGFFDWSVRWGGESRPVIGQSHPRT